VTRQTKSDAQRATEALAVADRKVKRLKADRAKHQGALNTVVAQLEAAEKRRDYLAQNPDLPQTQTPTEETSA
jgi:hypothetical protein